MSFQKTSRTNFGILLLVLSWITGTGALNLGLVREGNNIVAIPAFLVACSVWLFAQQLLRDGDRTGQRAALVVVFFWLFNLGFAAVIGRSLVYKTAFFAVSLPATVLLLILARTIRFQVTKKS